MMCPICVIFSVAFSGKYNSQCSFFPTNPALCTVQSSLITFKRSACQILGMLSVIQESREWAQKKWEILVYSPPWWTGRGKGACKPPVTHPSPAPQKNLASPFHAPAQPCLSKGGMERQSACPVGWAQPPHLLCKARPGTTSPSKANPRLSVASPLTLQAWLLLFYQFTGVDWTRWEGRPTAHWVKSQRRNGQSAPARQEGKG